MKRFVSLIISFVLCLSLSFNVFAEHYKGASDWSVTFTNNKKMEQNFTQSAISDTLRGLQPGDDAEFYISLTNGYKSETDWYMENEIIKSLEDFSNDSYTHGGDYTYKLVYTGPTGTQKVLFDSERVGGEIISPAGEGLDSATDGLTEWFYLDTLKSGQSGKVYLYIMLDGETQNNDYQDTLAELKARFAVELPQSSNGSSGESDSKHGFVAKTGDNYNIKLLAIAFIVAGIIILCVLLVRKKKSDKGGKKDEK